jgi:hypothetical protein
MQKIRYPQIQIRSKSEFSKHLVRKGFSKAKALKLINAVHHNFDYLWRDNKFRSKPEENKFVRSAKGTRLGVLLQKINYVVLQPYDFLLPEFVFGGIKGKSHVQGAAHLIGKKHYRVLLKADFKRFFEQVSYEHVVEFFRKSGCSEKMGELLASICCTPEGSKKAGDINKTLARGFATSSRLAVWCNIEQFMKLNELVQKRLKGKDPRIMIYVDDIGITASGVNKKEMESLYEEIKMLFLSNPEHKLILNEEKKKVMSHEEGLRILGTRINRNSLSVSAQTRSKIDLVKRKLADKNLSPEEKTELLGRYKNLSHYRRFVKNTLK